MRSIISEKDAVICSYTFTKEYKFIKHNMIAVCSIPCRPRAAPVSMSPVRVAPASIYPARAAPASIYPARAAPASIYPVRAAPASIYPVRAAPICRLRPLDAVLSSGLCGKEGALPPVTGLTVQRIICC